MVLGAEEGLALASQWELGAMLLLRDENGSIVERRNALFPLDARETRRRSDALSPGATL